MRKTIVLLVAIAFVFGALAVANGDAKEDACKALKDKVDTAVKAFDSAQAAYDKTCAKSDKIPGCGKLKKVLESSKKAKEDAEKAFKDQCGGEEEEE